VLTYKIGVVIIVFKVEAIACIALRADVKRKKR